MEDKRKKPISNKIIRRPSVQDAVIDDNNKVTRMVRVFNSCKQMIPLQMRPPGTSFYRYEQQIRLNPGQHALLPLDHLREDQLENLQKRGFIKIIYDSGSKNSKQN